MLSSDCLIFTLEILETGAISIFIKLDHLLTKWMAQSIIYTTRLSIQNDDIHYFILFDLMTCRS